MVEVCGRIMGVNEVGKMVEVGGEIMEVDEVGDEVPQVGTTGVEAGRTDAHEEGEFIKRLVDPRLPTEEEVKNHRVTHSPYRNWCPECVKAKGKDLDHMGAVDKERKLFEYGFDYCFPGDEFGDKMIFGRRGKVNRYEIRNGGPYKMIFRQVYCR